MKKNLYLSFFFLATSFAVFLGSGCATSSVNIQVLVPAHINVPADIQMLALVNRYRPDKGEGFLNVLEGALSGENIGQDRRSAEAALGGLTNALAGSPRFRITRPTIELRGTGRGDFPPPLPNMEVTSICDKSAAQALITIEAFDSDQTISFRTEERSRKLKSGEVQKYLVFCALKSIRVTVGWRMYEALSGDLVDEYRMIETVDFTSEGNSEDEARANLPEGEAVTRQIGEVTGNKYSQRISPTWLWVNRAYYKRGNDMLKAGKSAVKFNDWDRAEAHWNEAMQDEKLKNLGRAMFNLALAAEMRGDLQGALDKAKEAGQNYQNKKAVGYASLLRARIRDQEVLNEQMQGAPEN